MTGERLSGFLTLPKTVNPTYYKTKGVKIMTTNILNFEDALQQLSLIFPIVKELLEQNPDSNELSDIEQLLVEGIGDILKSNPQIKNSKEEKQILVRYNELF